jgi:hypothetical protein
MSEKPKDISKFITKTQAKVVITPAAEADINAVVTAAGAVNTEEGTHRCVAASLDDFLDCDFMRMSAWFKAQKEHTFVGLLLLNPDTKEPQSDVRLVVRADAPDKDDKHKVKLVVCSTTEATLPENYFDARVIEETRVLYRALLS